jgi:hypothetical protein
MAIHVADAAQILGRLDAFRKSDAERDTLLLEVVKAYETLKIEFEEQMADYNNEKESRRAWQSKATNTQKLIDQHTKQSASSNFAVALIDGDGALVSLSLAFQATRPVPASRRIVTLVYHAHRDMPAKIQIGHIIIELR